MKYTFQAPVQIGVHVYVIVHDDGETIIDELTVTEVASGGIFVSSYDPPEDDLGWYLPYADEGESWFLDKQTAEDAAE